MRPEIWKMVAEKAHWLGLSEEYFEGITLTENSVFKLKKAAPNKCAYEFDIKETPRCIFWINSPNANWNKKVFDLLKTCEKELEESLEVPLVWIAEGDSIKRGIAIEQDKKLNRTLDPTKDTPEELALHLLRSFYLMKDKLEHVVENSIEALY